MESDPMKPIVKMTFALLIALSAASLTASGPLGIYGIIEKVVFEPNETAPERIQVWGAFMYVEGTECARMPCPGGITVSSAKRGYLYFKLRSAYAGFTTESQVKNTLNEWADLKTVAGTGQAVAFGKWGYIAGFGSLRPDAPPVAPSVILEDKPQGGERADMRVRPASEPPANPATYQTNLGVVKLSEQGSQAAIVKQLRDVLKK
jgi:hypothetical protein